MKKFSLILALIMLVSCLGGAFAEAPAGEGASEGGPASAADVIDAANATANSEAAAEEEPRNFSRAGTSGNRFF